jgi:hypothetical protein
MIYIAIGAICFMCGLYVGNKGTRKEMIMDFEIYKDWYHKRYSCKERMIMK